jgi:hypothetical protein
MARSMTALSTQLSRPLGRPRKNAQQQFSKVPISKWVEFRIIAEKQDPPHCPCCRRPLIEDQFLVDLETNTVVFKGCIWKCAPQLTEFIFALYSKRPNCVSPIALGDAIWGVHAPEGDLLRQRLATYATHTRRMLEKQGVKIDNAHRRGFRLLLPEKCNA